MKHVITICEKELELLKAKCPKLKAYIEQVSMKDRFGDSDIFVAIMRNFVGQLISTKAADTIFKRIEDLLGVITPENVVMINELELKSCGISMKKVINMKTVAQDVVSGKLELDTLKEKSEAEIMEILVAYPGIGQWTVEMLMIFSLGKKDVISYLDLGIRGGIAKLYKIKKLDKKRFEKIRKKLSPHGTIASLYFWYAHADLNINQDK